MQIIIITKWNETTLLAKMQTDMKIIKQILHYCKNTLVTRELNQLLTESNTS